MTLLLAELEAETLGVESALRRIDEAEVIAGQVEFASQSPPCLYCAASVCSSAIHPLRSPREVSSQTALELAGLQGARSWGLRAALSLAKLHRSTGHPIEAHDVLAPALEGFSPSSELSEIAEAQALLAEVLA